MDTNDQNMNQNGQGTQTDPESQDNNTAGERNNQPMGFDEFLKQPGNQAEFDRRVNTAVQTGVKNAQEKWKTITDDKVSEAEKLAVMSATEKAQYLQKKKEKELDDREAEINRKELQAMAKNVLAEKKLPQELASILPYKDADTCKTAIDQVEKAFNTAVQDAVSDRLKGGEPMHKAEESSETDMAAEVARAIAGHI